MKRTIISGMAALAVMLVAAPAYAGGGGGPVGDPGDPGDCSLDPDCPAGGGEIPGDTGGGGGTGGSGGGTTTGGGATTAVGSGALLFTLDNLPTGSAGSFAAFQPSQDYSALNLMNIASAQGDLNQTVGGTTLSLRTADFVYSNANPTAAQTRIGTENESAFFPYLGVPADVKVAISATTLSTALPGAIYANFSDTLSYFSVNAFRLAGNGSFDVTLSAYSGANGTGTLLGTSTATISGGNNYLSQLVELSNLNGARSVALQGSSGLAHYDSITATLGAAVAAVPEPTSWALMIGGFGLVGSVMRRRRQISVRYI